MFAIPFISIICGATLNFKPELFRTYSTAYCPLLHNSDSGAFASSVPESDKNLTPSPARAPATGEKSIYDTVQSLQGFDPTKVREHRKHESWPAGGAAALPSLSL